MGGAVASAKQVAAAKRPRDADGERSAGNATEKLPGKAGQTVSFDPKDLPPPSALSGSAQRATGTNLESLAGGATSTSLHVNSRLIGHADLGSTSGTLDSRNLSTRLAELDESDAEEAMQKAMKAAEKRPSAIFLDPSLAGSEPFRFREAGSTNQQPALPKETQTDPEIVGTPEAGNRCILSGRWSRVQSAHYGLLPRDQDRELRTTRGPPRLGLGNAAWVDNSDFHSVRTPGRNSEIRLDPDTVACGSPAGNGGSRVVSLPEIPRLPASEQRAIVKDLHEGMRDSTSSPDNSPFGSSALMGDFSLDSPRERGHRHGGTRGNQYGVGFNSQFASCRRDQVVAHLPSRGAPARR